MNKFLTGSLVMVFLGCAQPGKLTFITKLPSKLDENSGIAPVDDTHVWVIEDKGNSNTMYKVSFNGDLVGEYNIHKAKNKDWEDLAKDPEGNLYIGDFGNNDNNRKDLAVYKIPNPELSAGEKIQAVKISFHYPQQQKFPPSQAHRWYDAEALFYADRQLFIITKDRSRPFTGKALVYAIPAEEGDHPAKLVATLHTCDNPDFCAVTSADISPDGKTLVLLGYGKLWVFSGFDPNDFSLGTMKTIDLGIASQLESLCFKDPGTLLLSDEQKGNTGRNLYSFSLTSE